MATLVIGSTPPTVEAVIAAARRAISALHIICLTEPQVIIVERMTVREAERVIGMWQGGNFLRLPFDGPDAWLILMQGLAQRTPPMEEADVSHLYCFAVIADALGHISLTTAWAIDWMLAPC